MEFRKQVTLEQILYLLAFVIGVLIRFYHLGHAELSDYEASLANQALALSKGNIISTISQPGYVVWTGGLFFLFGGTNFLARLLPSIIGSILILSPFLIRDQIGRLAALVVSFAIAIDPGLVAISKMAGGDMIALAFLSFAILALIIQKPILSGMCFAFALLAGPSFWQGIIILAVVTVWSNFADREKISGAGKINNWFKHYRSFSWKKWALSGGITLFFAGSFFFIVPTGITAVANGFLEFIHGWTALSLSALWMLLASLAIYEIVPIIFGFWGVMHSIKHRNNIDSFLSRFFITSLFFVLIYPAHQVIYIIWLVLPAWILSARRISDLLEIDREDQSAVAGLGAAIFVLLSFICLNGIGIFNGNGSDSDIQLRLIGLTGGLVLIVLALLFIGWGWSVQTALKGFVAGGLFTLLIFTISQSWRAGAISNTTTLELWNQSAKSPDDGLLVKTIADYSTWNSGFKQEPDLVVLNDIASPSIKWILRDFQKTEFVEFIPIDRNPSMVLSNMGYEIELSDNYSGQEFVINEHPDWDNYQLEDWFIWAMLRKTNLEKNYSVLWMNKNLFPAAESLEIGN